MKKQYKDRNPTARSRFRQAAANPGVTAGADSGRRCAIYARVSTQDQTVENQLADLREFASIRGWGVHEYVDEGVSGSRESRPALDELVRHAKRRRFDIVLCWRLDRLGRSLKHLVMLFDDLQALGVSFVSLAEGIDATTPAGRLQMHILGAMAEFERARVRERVISGLRRAKATGQRLGRPRKSQQGLPADLTVRAAAVSWGVSKSTAARRLAAGVRPGQTPFPNASVSPPNGDT